jgi:hypothetical protein
MKFLVILFTLIVYTQTFSEEKVFSVKTATNLYMKPDASSPVIYPVDHAKELIKKKKQGNWINVLDEKTGLVGWVLDEDFSESKPDKKFKSKNYDITFNNFKSRVLEMSKSIKEAIAIDTFLDVKHLGGAAALIIADDAWFEGRRHANQAFQVYELWRNENQSPSFLSFRNTKNEEQFIVLSGPHRPRYLKSNKK